MFVVIIGIRDFNFLQCPYFGLPSWLWGFVLYCFQEGLYLVAVIHYYYVVGMVVKGGEKEIFRLHHSLLLCLCFRSRDFTSVSASFKGVQIFLLITPLLCCNIPIYLLQCLPVLTWIFFSPQLRLQQAKVRWCAFTLAGIRAQYWPLVISFPLESRPLSRRI